MGLWWVGILGKIGLIDEWLRERLNQLVEWPDVVVERCLDSGLNPVIPRNERPG